MKKYLLLILIFSFVVIIQAQSQQKPLSVEALNKKITQQIADGKYAEAITTCNLVIAKQPKDSITIMVRSSLKARLGKNDEAIADIKKSIKNKDSAASVIAYLPLLAEFYRSNKSGEYYYKAAIAYAPKLGLPYFLYGGELSENGDHKKAMEYAGIGYPLLSLNEQKNFIDTYAQIFYAAGSTKEAYAILDSVIKEGTNNHEVYIRYLIFLRNDKRYPEAISLADQLFDKDSTEDYLYARYKIYNQMGNQEMICKDVDLLNKYFSGYENLLLEKKCPDAKAAIFPTLTTTYVFEVTTLKSVYNFNITNPKVNMSNEISFNWRMEAPVNKNGNVIISKEAVNSAHALLNSFAAGEFYSTDKTSVWVSNAVFQQIKNDGSTLIKSGNGAAKKFTVINDVEAMSTESLVAMNRDVNLGMKWMNVIHIKSEDGREEFWINDDPQNPIITKMVLGDTGMSVDLTEIKTKQ